MTQTITTRPMSGKRLACFVDGVRVFHMAKRDHKSFYSRVEKLRAQARTSDAAAIDAMWAFLSISLTVALRIERREAQPRVERVMANMPAVIALRNICKPKKTVERKGPMAALNDRLDEALERWDAAGRPVPTVPYPFNFTPKGRI